MGTLLTFLASLKNDATTPPLPPYFFAACPYPQFISDGGCDSCKWLMWCPGFVHVTSHLKEEANLLLFSLPLQPAR